MISVIQNGLREGGCATRFNNCFRQNRQDPLHFGPFEGVLLPKLCTKRLQMDDAAVVRGDFRPILGTLNHSCAINIKPILPCAKALRDAVY